jgi:hypothetical protein
MKNLLNFLKCKEINTRVNIPKTTSLKELIPSKDDVNNIGIPNIIYYPDTMTIVPEKELKLDVSLHVI